MITEPDTSQNLDPLKSLRQVVTLGALLLALIHLLRPTLAIDAVTLALLVIALLPWLAPIFKSLEFPGGWKVQFQELQKAAERAEKAGLLAAPSPRSPSEFAFQQLVGSDPNLALAGLRIEIEKRLNLLAERHGIEDRSHGLGRLLRRLMDQQALSAEASATLKEMGRLLASAVHGASVDPRAIEWAVNVGPRLLKALDDLVERT
jgi:hypothetical protein